jgi:hypothetical protein
MGWKQTLKKMFTVKKLSELTDEELFKKHRKQQILGAASALLALSFFGGVCLLCVPLIRYTSQLFATGEVSSIQALSLYAGPLSVIAVTGCWCLWIFYLSSDNGALDLEIRVREIKKDLEAQLP